MEQIRDRLAGLDVHRDEVRACVRTPGPRGGMHAEKARFRTTTGGPGRAGRLADAEWLADVAAHGMVRHSFVPPLRVRELRELTRYRRRQTDVRASEIARLEKVLQDAGTCPESTGPAPRSSSPKPAPT
jgi:hypothetical protein